MSLELAITCSVKAREDAIEQCAKLAEDRALKLRAKAKSQVAPSSRQSYFAQSIEARVIADLIRALKNDLQ